MAELKLPFSFSPGMEQLPSDQVQADFETLRKLVSDIDTKLEAFTNIKVGSTTLETDSTGNVLQSLQPCFLVQKNTTQQIAENLIGSNNFTVTFETEHYDRGGDFDLATEIFTAPIGGIYIFTFKADNTNFSAAVSYRYELVTSNRTYTGMWCSNTLTQSMFSILADLDAGDTAYINAFVFSSGTDTCDIRNDATFSGSLIN